MTPRERKIAACEALFDSPNEGEASAARHAYNRLVQSQDQANHTCAVSQKTPEQIKASRDFQVAAQLQEFFFEKGLWFDRDKERFLVCHDGHTLKVTSTIDEMIAYAGLSGFTLVGSGEVVAD